MLVSRKALFSPQALRVSVGLQGAVEWVSGEDKRSALYSLLAGPCISPTIKQLHSGLLARMGQRRRPNKNEAISWACRLWLTPNRAWMRSQDLFSFFCTWGFVVWTKVVNKPVTMDALAEMFIYLFFSPPWSSPAPGVSYSLPSLECA